MLEDLKFVANEFAKAFAITALIGAAWATFAVVWPAGF